MDVSRIKKFQTVSIWINLDGLCRVRSYYRGGSYLISSHPDLVTAFEAACDVERKKNAIAVVPASKGDAA